MVDGYKISEFLEKADITKLPGEAEWGRNASAETIQRALRGTVYESSLVPRDLADALLKTAKVFEEPEQLKPFIHFYDRAMGVLRYYVTALAVKVPLAGKLGFGGGALAGGAIGAALGGVPGAVGGAALGGMVGKFGAVPMFPGFIARNELSNLFNMWLGGFHDLNMLREAGRYQGIAKRAAETGDIALSKSPEMALWRLGQQLGAVGGVESSTGVWAGELQSQLARTEGAKGPWQKWTNWLFNPTETAHGKAGMAMNMWVENNAKFAMFLDGIKNKGLQPLEAAQRVKKYLFDYAALSPFEKSYLRRGAFFYTWVRNNLPLMVEASFTKFPQMRIYEHLTGEEPGSAQRRFLPEYQRQLGMFSGEEKPGGKRSFWGLDLPPSDLAMLSGEGAPPLTAARTILRKGVGMASPLLRLPVELATGVGLESGRPVSVFSRILSTLPATRVASVARMIGRVQAGEEPPESLWRLLGTKVKVVPSSEERAKISRALERVRLRREEQVARGLASPITSYAPRPGKENPFLHELNRAGSAYGRYLSQNPP